MKNKCIILLKAQLFNQFKLNNIKSGMKKGKNILLSFSFLLLGIMLLAYCYSIGYGLGKIGIAEVIPAYGVTITSIIILFFTSIKANGVLFAFKDYDLIMSMPVKTSTVIASRFLTMYILNLLFTLFVMIPMGVAYCVWERPGLIFYIFWILGIFIIPLIPTTIAAVIGAIIIGISSRFKNSGIAVTILSLAAIIFILVLSFSTVGMEEGDIDISKMTSLGSAVSQQINKIYPIAGFFSKAVLNYDFVSFGIFIVISLGWYYLFVKIVSIKYRTINTALNTHYSRSDYKFTKFKVKNKLIALYRKELKRFFGSYIYMINMGIGAIMLIVFSIMFFVTSYDNLTRVLGGTANIGIIYKVSPFIIAGFLGTTCTTCVSLSLEGKNLWILKSVPVDNETIYKSKIMVNLTILLPAAIISSTLFLIKLNMDLITGIIIYIYPIVYSFFIAIWGIFINIKFPNYQWDTEVMVVKQSVSSFLGIIGGGFFGVMPICLFFVVSELNYIFIYFLSTIIISSITALLYKYICKVKI